MDHEVFGLAPTSSRFVKLRVYSYGVIKTVQSLEFTCQEWSRIFLWPFRLRIVVFPGSSPKMLCLRRIDWFCLWDFLLDTVLSILSIVAWEVLRNYYRSPEGRTSWKWCTTQEWPNPLSATKKYERKTHSGPKLELVFHQLPQRIECAALYKRRWVHEIYPTYVEK